MIDRALRLLGRLLPVSLVELAAKRLVLGRVSTLPPDRALRLLFRLTATFEHHIGLQARAYGQGVHPKHRHTRYHEFFVRRLSAGERVLDVGCGTGDLAADMAVRAEAQVMGIDVLAANIDEAGRRHQSSNLRFLAGDATRFEGSERFDTVVLSNVLEHLQDRPQVLRRLAQACRPHRFLIRVPLFERDWTVPLKRELGLDWRSDPTHETEYTLESFAQEMQDAGLVIRHQEIHWGEIWAEAAPTESRQPNTMQTAHSE